jgi:hypothetical protein
MKNDVHASEQRSHRLLIADIRDNKLDVLSKHTLKILRFSIYEIIDNENVEAASRQLPNQLRTDKSGAACYQNSLLGQSNHPTEKIEKIGMTILPNYISVTG